MTLKIGSRKPVQVATFAEASAHYEEIRDRSGLGASRLPFGDVLDEAGKPVAVVSYNGRVWATENDPRTRYTPGATPLYDNREVQP